MEQNEGEGRESTAKKLCFCPIIGLSIEEFFVLPHSLLRLNCPRASLTSTSQLAASSSTISKEMEFSHHDNRPFHFRRISIQSYSSSSSLSHQDEGLTCHLKKSPLKRKSLDHKQDKEELFKSNFLTLHTVLKSSQKSHFVIINACFHKRSPSMNVSRIEISSFDV